MGRNKTRKEYTCIYKVAGDFVEGRTAYHRVVGRYTNPEQAKIAIQALCIKDSVKLGNPQNAPIVEFMAFETGRSLKTK